MSKKNKNDVILCIIVFCYAIFLFLVVLDNSATKTANNSLKERIDFVNKKCNAKHWVGTNRETK